MVCELLPSKPKLSCPSNTSRCCDPNCDGSSSWGQCTLRRTNAHCTEAVNDPKATGRWNALRQALTAGTPAAGFDANGVHVHKKVQILADGQGKPLPEPTSAVTCVSVHITTDASLPADADTLKVGKAERLWAGGRQVAPAASDHTAGQIPGLGHRLSDSLPSRPGHPVF